MGDYFILAGRRNEIIPDIIELDLEEDEALDKYTKYIELYTANCECDNCVWSEDCKVTSDGAVIIKGLSLNEGHVIDIIALYRWTTKY